MKENLRKIIKKAEKILHKVIKTKKTAHETALGFSVGTFIAILPTPGLNIILTIIIALISKKINKLTLFGALAFWNPIFMIPIYFISTTIGKIILEITKQEFGFRIFEKFYYFLYDLFPITIKESLRFTYTLGLKYLIGSTILAFVLGIGSYFLVRKLSENHKRRLLEKKKTRKSHRV